MRLAARGVGFRYSAGARPALADLSFDAEAGSYWCLAGPNGSGKSTFLKLACGLLPTGLLSGDLTWDGKPLSQWSRLELARRIAFVPGSLRTQFPVSVRDFVLQGRYARSEYWSRHSPRDREAAQSAMERVGIAPHAEADVTEISAGETQLALIARALAQDPKVLVLDEATSNLDLGYQARVFGLIAELNRQGLTILIVSHDLNLAAEFCPNAIWLREGSTFAQGPMAETLSNALVRELYGTESRIEVGKNPFTSRPKIFWRHM